MKRLFILALVTCLTGIIPLHASTPDPKEGVQQAAMDYMDGAHAGDAERVVRAIHPELNKVSVMPLPNGRQVLRRAGYSRLVELVRGNAVPVPADKRDIQLNIQYVDKGIAAVTITSAMFHELLQLAQVDGEWRIINTLFTRQTMASKDETGWVRELPAIKQAALDYIEGAFTADGKRMETAIHPALNKAIPVKHPKTGRTLLNYTTSDLLIEGAAAGVIALDKEQWHLDLKVLDIYQDVASVAVASTPYMDLLQLARINGQWKIVNVLWVSNPKPEAPGHPE